MRKVRAPSMLWVCLTLLSVVLILAGCGRFLPGNASAATARARSVLADVLQAQPHGTPQIAAYVATTYGQFVDNLAPESRPTDSTASPSDPVLIVKVFGTFPQAHRGPEGANTDATTIVAVFDEAVGRTVEVTYFAGPVSHDLAPNVDATTPVYADLLALGTPVSLMP